MNLYHHRRVKQFHHFINHDIQTPPPCLKCTDKLERDRLILFLNKLILHKVIL